MNAQPVAGHALSPLQQLRPCDMAPVPLGVPISSLAPAVQGLLVCRVNGEWLARESWASLTREGDVIEWHEVPQDRDLLRTALSIAAIAILGPYGFGLQGAALIAANLVAQTAINALLPPVGPEQVARPQQTGTPFSTSLAGNEARIDQPIWKICGQREINPPFAAQPYFEYRPRAGDSDADPDLDNDQYFFALFAVGVGNHDVVAKIGNTPISRFADVLQATYLPPGTLPSEVLGNVTSAVEVSSPQTLESGRYVGGYAACSPRRTCSAIGVDVSAVRGLGKTGALTVTWRVEYREINDFGQVLGNWQTLANETRTAFTATPQRWSDRYELPTAARVEVRLVRTDVQDKDPAALHELAWIGLRAYLAEPALLNADTAHFEVVMRASSQLSQSASRDLRLIAQAYCRTLNPDLTWGAEVHTRNWVWWCLDLLTSNTWGMDKADERIDLQSFYDLAVQADARQDRFDYVFDSTMSGWDAAQLIARAGRSRVFRRNGVISIARDELADVPVTAFTPRNCQPGISISETLRQRRSPDGVIVEYQDYRTNDWTEIPCPIPGVELTDMAYPVLLRLEGIVGPKHAEREGRYEAARMLYRNRTASLTTEMQGMLPAYMSPVLVVPDQVGYALSGDVVDFNAGSLQMTLSEEPDWDAGELYITLVRDDGTLTNPIRVTPGPTSYDVTLDSAPGFTLYVDDGTRERPKFLLGPLEGSRELVKVQNISDGGLSDEGAQLYALVGLVDDERVHIADNDLLPGPGEIQDPLGLPDDAGGVDTGAGTLLYPNLTDGEIYFGSYDSGQTNGMSIEYRLASNGVLRLTGTGAGDLGYALAVYGSGGFGPTMGDFNDGTLDVANQWNLYGEAEPIAGAAYEVQFNTYSQTLPGPTVSYSGTVDAWLSLASDQALKIDITGLDNYAFWTFRVRIRDAATEIVAVDRTVLISCGYTDITSPGGA